ncbi:MAG: hypothetical protein U0M15_07165, partial [Bacillota bacterium]|nr:hypothetical protein [Bacillota bacterium]
ISSVLFWGFVAGSFRLITSGDGAENAVPFPRHYDAALFICKAKTGGTALYHCFFPRHNLNVFIHKNRILSCLLADSSFFPFCKSANGAVLRHLNAAACLFLSDTYSVFS